MEAEERDMYIYFPEIPMRSPFRRYSLVIVRPDASRESAEELMEAWGLKELADREALVISFPNPGCGGWRLSDLEHELHLLRSMENEMCTSGSARITYTPKGIPDFLSMSQRWHLMNDTRYYIGIGDGASVVYGLSLLYPEAVAGMVCIGGQVCGDLLHKAVTAPMPAWLYQAPEELLHFLVTKDNEAEFICEDQEKCIYENKLNHLMRVTSWRQKPVLDSCWMEKVYVDFFKTIRRINTGMHGDIDARMDDAASLFECHLEDTGLADGVVHTWFIHMPQTVRHGNHKVPLVMFLHGGSDNPAEAAQMSRFHEIGEKEGFITVYPWGTNRASWNSDCNPDDADDDAYLLALVRHMIDKYPVDASRIYVSGFSNGAAQAQVFAMLHPELTAGLCHIDSNWPGKRDGTTALSLEDVRPFAMAMERKKQFDYRMPVWYTYGTREPSYPVYRGCSQQHQYDFWKRYNNIPIKETPPKEQPDPCGCGIEGDKREQLHPLKGYPHLWYDVQRFYTLEGQNLYNYVVVHDKGHDIAPADAWLGWNFVKNFRRLPDGCLEQC